MSRVSKEIKLSELRGSLSHDRSVSNRYNLLKYVAIFLDQKEIAAKVVKNILESLDKARARGHKIDEQIIGLAMQREIEWILEGTKFWKDLDINNKFYTANQIFSMSKVNTLLQSVMSGLESIEDRIDEAGFQRLTGIETLTKGQIWNLKMKEARERKKREREQELEQSGSKVEAKVEEVEEVQELTPTPEPPKLEEPNQDPTSAKEALVEELGDAYKDLAEHMTEAELRELAELNDLNF